MGIPSLTFKKSRVARRVSAATLVPLACSAHRAEAIVFLPLTLQCNQDSAIVNILAEKLSESL